MKILIAEDEPILQMALEDILNDLGHSVVAAVSTVKETLEHLEDRKPDLAILDVHLADGTCETTLPWFRAAGVQIILATGSMMPAPEGCMIIGKPYNTEQIRHAIALAAGETARAAR